MVSYNAGEAQIRIVPSAEGFRQKLEADLKKIRAEFAVQVSADTAQARADIERFRVLEQRNGLRLGVDVALAQAQADLERFRAQQRGNDIDIKVKVDQSSSNKAKNDFESLK